MKEYCAGEYDVVVIGGGHAGCEAGIAAAKLGAKTIIFTLSLDTVANLPCNPSIGGTAKGHLVREIDALGGEMGKVADKTTIQSRMLNKGKGPAVYSLRAQVDRNRYGIEMKKVVENQENLELKQDEIADILLDGNKVVGVQTKLGVIYKAKTVILATGTYLSGVVHIGEITFPSGPDGTLPANILGGKLKEMGLTTRRFKTGTPARVHRNTIDFSELESQSGDEKVVPFSFDTIEPPKNLVDCYITYTNKNTHEVIMANLDRSPMYGYHTIEGPGPRYCPSIEDKVVRFPEKERHQIFVEPMGLDTSEMYLSGMASSLPEDVQIDFYKTLKGFENASIMRPAYAIEYDCVDPTELYPTLEFKKYTGLYGAGQFNGSSGYEEAACQGLIAGINAARSSQGKEAFVLDRSTSYIGTLIDDLVTKGCNDPYRMMTSRSEYRLVLRQDNADQRLMPYGYELGLVSKERYEKMLYKVSLIEKEKKRFEHTNIAPSEEINKVLVEKGTSPLTTGIKLSALIRRPQIEYADIRPFDEGASDLPDDVIEQVEIMINYEGYIKRQDAQIEEMRRLEVKKLPEDVDYYGISGIRAEAKEKLTKGRPMNISQASRISGVSPSDISVLLIWLARYEKENDNNEGN